MSNFGFALTVAPKGAYVGVLPPSMSPVIEATYNTETTQIDVTTTATGTAYWLLDSETTQDVATVVVGGGEASGSAAVSGNGTFVIDLTGVSADDYKLHIVLIRSGDDEPSNVVTLDITVLGLFLGIEATGGTEFEYEDAFGQWWRSHDLATGTGSLVCTVGGPIRLLAVGGGGYGAGTGGAGGASGGVIRRQLADNFILAPGSYDISIGVGGLGGTGLGTIGTDTTGIGLTARRGGRGGNTATKKGLDGGSGGGAGFGSGYDPDLRGLALQPGDAAPNTGLGFPGSTAGSGAGGGGGGAGGAAVVGSTSTGGVGGAGITDDIRTGSPEEFAAGGGGAGNTSGGAAGGSTAGAGVAGSGNGGDATAGTGSGGGGSRQTGRGGHGASGRFIIAYPIPTP
jgi:hypothetical protein